jgi:hypothetical protein
MLITSTHRGASSIFAPEPAARANWRSEQCFVSYSFFGNFLVSYRKLRFSVCWCSFLNLSLTSKPYRVTCWKIQFHMSSLVSWLAYR